MEDNITLPYLPAEWCFNMEQWLQNVAKPNISEQMFAKYEVYKEFSYRYNGLLTLFLILFGLMGSSVLLKQIYGSRLFSKRLAVHLGMICFWDILYLLCCLSTYCVPSLRHQVTPIYGPFAYILFFLQPFASFCVSCTIWQVFAITLERYLAVSSPLEQRTRKAKFGVYWICLVITTCAFIINLLPVPFENELVDCYELGFDMPTGSPTFTNHTMMKPYYDDRIRIYKFLVHFLPDLIFRAPLPIIIIGYLTIRTIQACGQRSVGNFQIGMRFNKNMPLRLSLLNFKFIICNTLYMFNTILLELLEYGNMENGDYDGYINSFYLTDASNMLLVVHSATNWLLFCNLPSCRKKDTTSMTLSSSVKHTAINHRVAEYIHKMVNPIATGVGYDIIHKLCEEMPQVKEMMLSIANDNDQHDKETLIGYEIGNFICHVFKSFGSRNRRSHKVAYKQYTDAASKAKLNFRPLQWKTIRSIVVELIVLHINASTKEAAGKQALYEPHEVEECATRVFNHVLSEMRSGVLCASVDEKQKKQDRYTRSLSANNAAPTFREPTREPPRKSHSVTMRIHYSSSVDSVQTGEQTHLIYQE